MLLNELELMDLHRDALYRRDDAGRLHSVNESPYPPAPRLWMGRTRAGNRWSLRCDLPAGLAAELERLLAGAPIAAELDPAPWMHEPILALLEQHAPVSSEYRGPAYWIPDQLPVQGKAVIVTRENVDVLANRSAWLTECARNPHAVRSRPCSTANVPWGTVTARALQPQPARPVSRSTKPIVGAATPAWPSLPGPPRCAPPAACRCTAPGGNSASPAVARRLNMVQYGEDWSVD